MHAAGAHQAPCFGGPREATPAHQKSVKKPLYKPPCFGFSFLGGIFEFPHIKLPLDGTTAMLGWLGRLLSFGAGWYSASVFPWSRAIGLRGKAGGAAGRKRSRSGPTSFARLLASCFLRSNLTLVDQVALARSIPSAWSSPFLVSLPPSRRRVR